MNTTFSFKPAFKIPLLILMATGMAAIAVSLTTMHDQGARFWANFLLNNVYALAISITGVVFIAIHVLGNSGWHVGLQRIPEAMSAFLPVGALFMLIVLLGMWFDLHHIYHWVHPEPDDAVLQMKRAYLNVPGFSFRTFIYLTGWILLARWMRSVSLRQDADPDIKHFKKSLTVSGIFIVFFAITGSMSSWDWLMSIDPHWFSTLYGWYVFSGFLVSGVAVIILITVLLKKTGYLPHINKEHLHDLGKYLFAFSILWAYLWFSQFMLIWYGNIPEETVYFTARLEGFNSIFYINPALNFVFPFLVLMTRNSKRFPPVLVLVSLVVLAGHWLDLYLLIIPGTLGPEAGIGFVEIGMTLGYIGLFLFVTFRTLAKSSLVPENHPFLKESLKYHTQY